MYCQNLANNEQSKNYNHLEAYSVTRHTQTYTWRKEATIASNWLYMGLFMVEQSEVTLSLIIIIHNYKYFNDNSETG